MQGISLFCFGTVIDMIAITACGLMQQSAGWKEHRGEMYRIRRIILSRTATISLLLVGTAWDVGSTYAMVGERLWLDGNPFIRTLNWEQVLALQFIFGTASVAAFLFAYGRQPVIWPEEKLSFPAFVVFRIKRGFSLNFTAQHFRTEDVYAGMLLIWVLIFAHSLAGLINTVPLMGGPPLLEILHMKHAFDLDTLQNIGTGLLILCSIFLAHYPIYARYALSLEERRTAHSA